MENTCTATHFLINNSQFIVFNLEEYTKIAFSYTYCVRKKKIKAKCSFLTFLEFFSAFNSLFTQIDCSLFELPFSRYLTWRNFGTDKDISILFLLLNKEKYID